MKFKNKYGAFELTPDALWQRAYPGMLPTVADQRYLLRSEARLALLVVRVHGYSRISGLYGSGSKTDEYDVMVRAGRLTIGCITFTELQTRRIRTWARKGRG